MINDARQFLQTDVIVVGLAVYGILGLLADLGRPLPREEGAVMALLANRTPSRPASGRSTPDGGSPGSASTTARSAADVLDGLDLDVHAGEFVALLGRSGSGKSTLLRSLAGLDPAPAEEISVSGRTPSPSRSRGCCRGDASGERRAGPAQLPPGQARRTARRALEEVGLHGKRDAWPLALSGGEAQRVSLARHWSASPTCCCWTSRSARSTH